MWSINFAPTLLLYYYYKKIFSVQVWEFLFINTCIVREPWVEALISEKNPTKNAANMDNLRQAVDSKGKHKPSHLKNLTASSYQQLK